MISLIVIHDKNYGIGNNGNIPWKFKQDLKFFREETDNNIIIMGKNTWNSIPEQYRGLKNRINIIISTSITYDKLKKENNTNSKIYLENNLEDGIKLGLNIQKLENKKIYIIGGSEIYKQTINNNLIDELVITEIDDTYKTDCFINYSNLTLNNYFTKEIEDIDQTTNKLIKLKFNKYKVLDPVRKYKLDKNGEIQYLEILEKIYNSTETKRQTRNGFTYSIFGEQIKIDLQKEFPIFTTKKMFWRGIVEELLFFISGKTDANILNNKGIKIWELNTSKTFLDSVNLNYDVGDMGPMYGFNWRHFGSNYINKDTDYNNKGIDQLMYIINTLKSDPFNRRMIMTTYDPLTVNKCVLYPCHGIVTQFYVSNEGYLDCITYQRSADAFLGLPFNITSYALLVHIICHFINSGDRILELKPRYLITYLGDVHLYEEHIESVKKQIKREPLFPPKIKINKQKPTDISDYKFEDIELINYIYYDQIKANMKM